MEGLGGNSSFVMYSLCTDFVVLHAYIYACSSLVYAVVLRSLGLAMVLRCYIR